MLKKIRNWFIEQIPLSTRLHMGRVLIILLPLLTFAEPTFAQIAAIAGGVVAFTFLPMLLGLIASLIGTFTTFIIYLIDNLILPGQNSLLFDNPVIQDVWSMMQGAANVLFFLAILAMSVMIITRSAGYNFKKAITSLITAVVLANLSFVIVRVLIEAGDALRNSAGTVFNSAGATAQGMWGLFTGVFIDPGTLENAGSIINQYVSSGNLTFFDAIGNGIFMIIVGLIGLYVFFRLAFILIERTVQLVIRVIFAPIIFALSVLPHPELQKMATTWWSDVIRWVLVLPLAFLLVGVAHSLAVYQSASIYGIVTSFTDGSQSVATHTGDLLFAIVIVAILIAAGNVHQMLNVPISAATKFFTDTIPGAIKGGATFLGGGLMRDAALKLGSTKPGKFVRKQVGRIQSGRQIFKEGTYRAFDKQVQKDTNLATIKKARSSRKHLDDNMNVDIASELGVSASEAKRFNKAGTEDEKARYKNAKDKVAPKYAMEKTKVESEELAAMVASGKLINDNWDLHRTTAELDKAVRGSMDDAIKAKQEGRIDDAHEHEIAAATDAGTIKMQYVRFAGNKSITAGETLNKLLKDYKDLEDIPQPKMRFKPVDINKSGKKEDDGATGYGSATTSDEQQVRHFTTKDAYDTAQAAQRNVAKDVDDGFATTVNATINQEGGSAVLQMLQESAQKGETEKIDTIGEVAELLKKLNTDGVNKIAGFEGNEKNQSELKSALQKETGMSAEDSEKAAEVLNDIGVKNIANVGAVAASLSQSRKSEDGGTKAKIDYIKQTQVTATTTKEYEISKAQQAQAESLEVNEQRIKEASTGTEPYSIKEIQDDIAEATQQLSQMILKSSNNKDEQLATYQKQTLKQLNFTNRAQFKQLTTKILGKLKHQFNGSIIDNENQIDQMTPKQIYNILEASGASADKLSKENK